MSTSDHGTTEAFGTISIERPRSMLAIYDAPQAMRAFDPQVEPLPVAELVGQLEALQARGVRCVLLTVDMLGGQTDAGIVLYDALLRFREAGGVVVAHIPKVAASTGSWLIGAADYVVIARGARIIVHGSVDMLTDKPIPVEPDGADHRMHLAVYCSRTLSRRAAIEEALRRFPNDRGEPMFSWLDTDHALGNGWADFEGDEAAARRLAQQLPELLATAPGAVLPTPRRMALAERQAQGEHDEWREPLQWMRRRAAELRARMRGGWIAPTPGMLAAMSIKSQHIDTDVLSTTNYAQDGSGNPTAGAKLDHKGTALKVAAGNLQIGPYLLSNMLRYLGAFSCTAPASEFTISGLSEPDGNYAILLYPIGGNYNNPGATNLKFMDRQTSYVVCRFWEAAQHAQSPYVLWAAYLLRTP